MGNHPRVSAPLPDVFNMEPPQPKHPFIWNVETVLNLLRKLSGNGLLSNILLILKVPMLLTLLSALRYQRFNLRVDYLKKHPSIYTFAVPHLTETCQRGKRVPIWKFYNFPIDSCPERCKVLGLRRWGWGKSISC